MGSSRIPPEITNCFVYFLTVDHFSYYIINCYGGDSNLELAVAIVKRFMSYSDSIRKKARSAWFEKLNELNSSLISSSNC